MNKLAHRCTALLAAAALVLPIVSRAEEQGEVRNGGVTTMLKNRDYELVMKPTVATVFVYQDEKPAAMKGATGTLTIMQGDKKATYPLVPTGTNALEAKGAFAAGGKAAATITLAGRKPQDVTWALK